jgi:hypothetical protein
VQQGNQNDPCTLYGTRRSVIQCRCKHQQLNFLGMKNSIIFISALSLAAMTLASCESIPSAYNPFASDETATTIEPSGPPVPGETKKSQP